MDTISNRQSCHTNCVVHILGQVGERLKVYIQGPLTLKKNELHHVLICKQVRRALWGLFPQGDCGGGSAIREGYQEIRTSTA
jgi:hypothetical protein